MQVKTYAQAADVIVKAAASAPKTSNIQYAAAYADAGRGMSEKDQRQQALYILSNLTAWRGDDAKRVREFFKDFVGKK